MISIFSGKQGEFKTAKGVKHVKTGIFCLILAGAAWTDATEGKIRNWWLLAGTAAGIWCRGRVFFPAAAVVLALAFLLFRLRMMGAGDGKLMALIAGYLGMEAGMEAILTGMAVGACWSLCRLWHNKSLKTHLVYLTAYFMRLFQTKKVEVYGDGALKDPERTIPLAPCMAAGTYLYLMVSGAVSVWMGR
ncbi:hypothetical protein D3Z51_05715 [Clostridiaceae bacterium]|nr:hypothetical protein [Clostridiaceae bacterium]RKI16042.1 hypothetical protein D7V81_05230 [bacterium 1XD21-70]